MLMEISKRWLATLLALGVFGCSADAPDAQARGTDSTGLSAPRTAMGKATIGRDGAEVTVDGTWSATLTVKQEPGDLDTLELGLRAGSSDGREAVSVFLVRAAQIDRDAFSPIDTFELGYERQPHSSGVLSVTLDGEEHVSTDGELGTDIGSVTISEMSAGQVVASAWARLEDGTRVEVSFQGSVDFRCFVLPPGAPPSQDGEGAHEQGSLEDPFCAGYLGVH